MNTGNTIIMGIVAASLMFFVADHSYGTESTVIKTVDKDLVANDTRSETVKQLKTRIESLEDKIEKFRAGVKDGPNSALDNKLIKTLDSLDVKTEKFHSEIDKLLLSDRKDLWTAKKKEMVVTIENMENQYLQLHKNFSHLK